jgi:hypothetical protein
MHVLRESMPRMPPRYCAQRRRRGQIATIDIVYEDGRGHQQNEARSRCGLTHRAGSDRSGAYLTATTTLPITDPLSTAICAFDVSSRENRAPM